MTGRRITNKLSVFVAATSLAAVLSAAPYQYDADGVAGSISEGTIGWNLSDVVWSNGGNISAWPNTNADVAIFGGGGAGTAGIVTVGSVIANGITFNTPFQGSYTLGTGDITLAGTTPTITMNASAAISAALKGTGGMTVTGSGTLTLSGSNNNTLTGTTTVTGATIIMSKTSGVNAFADNISLSSGTLQWNASNQIADTAGITLSGGLVNFGSQSEKFASYTQTAGGITGNNAANVEVTGAFSISGGNQFVLNSGANWRVGSMSLSGTGILMGGNNTSVVTMLTIGSGGLNIAGQTIQMNLGVATSPNNAKGNRIVFEGDITASGTSEIKADSAGALLSGSVTELSLGANRGISVASGGTLKFSNSLSVTGTGIVKSGAGILSFGVTAGSNAIDVGTITVNAGTLQWAGSNQIADNTAIVVDGGSSAVLVQFAGQSETFASYTQLSGTVDGFRTGSPSSGSSLVKITGAYRMSGGPLGQINSGTVLDVGSMDFTGSTGQVFQIGGNNTSIISSLIIGSGGLTLSGQSMLLFKPTAVNAKGNEIVLNGNVTASGASSIVYDSQGAILSGAVSQVQLGSATRTFNVATGGSLDMAVVIAGASGGVTKTGAGSMLYTGQSANTYTGDTLVNGGVLQLSKTNNVNAIAGNVTVNSGGTLYWFSSLGTNSHHQIADTSSITQTTGSVVNFNYRSETILNYTKTGGSVTGTGGVLVVSGLLTVSGGNSNTDTGDLENGNRLTVNSGGSFTANTATFVGSGTNALLVGGNNANTITRFIIGSGGLTLQDNTFIFVKGPAVAVGADPTQGSEFVLGGNLTASGANNFNTNNDPNGVARLNLSGGERTFNITGGTTTSNLEVVSKTLAPKVADTADTATPGGIYKTGAGTLVLNANNTYTGKTTVNEGTFRIASSIGGIKDSVWLQVNSGATFQNSTGATYIHDGILSGSGTVSGNIRIGDNSGSVNGTGILKVGDTSNAALSTTAGDLVGTLTFANDLTLDGPTSPAGSTIRAELQIFGATGNAVSSLGTDDVATWVAGIPTSHSTLVTGTPGNHDHLEVSGRLTLNDNGIIQVTLPDNTYVPRFGDVINLIDWVNLTNNGFSAGTNWRTGGLGGDGDLDLQDIGSYGLAWDVSHFLTRGVLVVVPEPGRGMLMLFGMLCLCLRRQRVRS